MEEKSNFRFWTGQKLKVRRNTRFRGIFGEIQRIKTCIVGSPKNVNFNLLTFKKCLYDNDFWPISLEDLNIISGAWNGFSGNYRESCDQLFFLNLDFWKYSFWSQDWSVH